MSLWWTFWKSVWHIKFVQHKLSRHVYIIQISKASPISIDLTPCWDSWFFFFSSLYSCIPFPSWRWCLTKALHQVSYFVSLHHFYFISQFFLCRIVNFFFNRFWVFSIFKGSEASIFWSFYPLIPFSFVFILP